MPAPTNNQPGQVGALSPLDTSNTNPAAAPLFAHDRLSAHVELSEKTASTRRTVRALRDWRLYAFACLMLVAASVRLVNLGQVPPFVDEDGYSTFAQKVAPLTWKQVLVHSEMLVPLTGDKPPLAIVSQAWLNRIVGDIVVSGRLLSAMAGIVTTILCFFLGRRLGGNTIGLISMAAYAVSPLAVVHERMVLQDPLMSVFSLAAVLLAWTSMEHGSLRVAGMSAMAGALAVQLKVSGLVTAPLILGLIVVVADNAQRRLWYLAAVGAAGVVLSYVLLMLGPGSVSLQEQNQKLLVPLGFIGTNLEVLRDAVSTYFAWGLSLLVLLGLAVSARLKQRGGLICAVAILVWVAPWVVLSRFSPSRYYLSADPYACALLALGTFWLVSAAAKLGPLIRVGVGCLASATFLIAGATSVHIATDFLTAPLSALDDCQYRSCWPSGYPYRAALQFIDSAIPSGSSLAYVVDTDHRIALGLDRPPPAGIQSLGVIARGDALPAAAMQSGAYVVVDDVRDTQSGSGLEALLANYPRYTVVAQFFRPGSSGGVTIVRSP